MDYNIDYFIKKFEAIPEKMWITLNRGALGTPRCALGHCYNGVNGHAEEEALSKLFIENGLTYIEGLNYESDKKYYIRPGKGPAVALINNGMIHEYQQPTPKQRILAALYDIKKATQPKEVVREKTVYVAVPITLNKQARELLTFN